MRGGTTSAVDSQVYTLAGGDFCCGVPGVGNRTFFKGYLDADERSPEEHFTRLYARATQGAAAPPPLSPPRRPSSARQAPSERRRRSAAIDGGSAGLGWHSSPALAGLSTTGNTAATSSTLYRARWGAVSPSRRAASSTPRTCRRRRRLRLRTTCRACSAIRRETVETFDILISTYPINVSVSVYEVHVRHTVVRRRRGETTRHQLHEQPRRDEYRRVSQSGQVRLGRVDDVVSPEGRGPACSVVTTWTKGGMSPATRTASAPQRKHTHARTGAAGTSTRGFLHSRSSTGTSTPRIGRKVHAASGRPPTPNVAST